MNIDWWTLGLQAINVLVLVWLLARFFWRPVAGMIEQRKEAAKKLLDDAEASRDAAATAKAEIEKTRAGMAGERAGMIADARADADRQRTEMLEKARAEAAAVSKAAQAGDAKDRAAAEAAWTERAATLAVEIAGRLAARLDGDAVRAAFMQWLIDAIGALPEATRAGVGADGVVLELSSAEAMGDEAQAACAKAIRKAFSAEPEIRFKVDPALIAGLELHGPHVVIENSWRADLRSVKAGLSDA